LGKVSVLHNINCANAHRGHCDLLKRMEGNRANNFDSLYKKWFEVFDVKLLSKRFYDELFEWYQWAMSLVGSGRMRFPAWPKDGHGKESRDETVIRIITRMLFIWFIKEKGLIPATLFNKQELKRIVKDFNPQSVSAHNYYNAILQNLFFATLNCEKPERKFIPESYHGKNDGYGVNSLYRGDDLLNIGKEEFMALFKNIPYLNGGLFERLDNGQNYYDGFSKEARRRAIVPDMLFFREDVNDGHCGLITLFEKYVFTVEENTPIEQDISLDPELLGRVFENLLGAYNPETQETARKATGSYYTPREIVEYMVNESLVQHLTKTGIDEKQIRDLLEYHDGSQTELTDEQRKKMMTSLYHVKILDPACGSGAFPMGMLQQMVHVLRQIDPNNAHWQAFIKTTAGAQAEQAYTKTNDAETRKLQLDEIENAFNLRLANPDYARKLFIIQNCIYGVDIQPIAMQISKLRFFISLISEQNNDNILPLPNLETKFVCANTLIGVDKNGGSFSSDELEQKKDELIDVRKKLFYARTAKTKKKYRDEDDKIREELEGMIADMAGLGTSVAKQLVSWNPYDQNASSPFFDAEWMFGVKDGFDVVIGNPPYFQMKKGCVSKTVYPFSEGKDTGKQNIYKLFIELSYNSLIDNGIGSLITQSSLMCDASAQYTRELLLKHTTLHQVIEFPKVAPHPEGQLFKGALVATCITIFKKTPADNAHVFYLSANNDLTTINQFDFAELKQTEPLSFYPNGYCLPLIRKNDFPIIEKMNSGTIFLEKLISKSSQGDFNLTNEKHCFSTRISDVKMYRGCHIHRYYMDDDVQEYIQNNYKAELIYSNMTNTWLICQNISGMTDKNRFNVAITKGNKCLFGHSVDKILLKANTNSKFILALLNSKMIDWYFRKTSTNNHVNIYELEQLPIPTATPLQQQPIIALVDKILAAKKANPQADTSAWERKIDELVYELYGLTPEEIAVIEQ